MSVSVNVSVGLGIGGGGGTSVNLGYDPSKSGFDAFSASITGTGQLGAAAAADASVGFSVSTTDQCDVSGLLGRFYEVSGPSISGFGGGTILDANGQPTGGFLSGGVSVPGSVSAGSVTASETSAVVQVNGDGSVLVGTSNGKSAIWSSR